jgi:phosphoribosylaminoimidazole-succinocarboxamide synthase
MFFPQHVPPMNSPLLSSDLPGLPKRAGKVRDVYDLGEQLLLVASDRISAFDWVLPNGIPDKGRILTQLSKFWFAQLGVPHHLITDDVTAMPLPIGVDRNALAGRTMLVQKTNVFPIECVVRGYLAGSGWKEYQKGNNVCGVALPGGLKESSRLGEPIFTPATKAETGHDENISFARMCEIIGKSVAGELRDRTIDVYLRGAKHAESKGILIADTKLEWGEHGGQIILIDEVLTPDSSRFWPAESYREGSSPPSFDKQFVRDWLEASGWDKASLPPSLPQEVIVGTRQKYVEAYEKLTGQPFAWT